MTWEIAVGLFTLASAFIAVMNVVVRVNKTLTALDISVKNLDETVKRQSDTNEEIFYRLAKQERRIIMLELEHGHTGGSAARRPSERRDAGEVEA